MWAYFNAVLFGGALGDVILNFSRLARSLHGAHRLVLKGPSRRAPEEASEK
jgi:hypothetical protein